ncbi:YrhA family protein [Stenotrophomonas sp.]|uniref:YrhA family protein n=1 Tax=Stenotrophomonas sp. TaxID=69392 RepID=UPI0028A87F64|nr:YrhA family protein [Stenotrophomonas sp.]
MQPSIEARLLKLRAALSEAEMYLGPSLGRSDTEALQGLARSKLGTALPDSYLDFLSRHDGLVVEGVFLYSSIPRSYTDGGSAPSLVEMNLLARDLGFMDSYVELGESDMDCYVFDSRTGRYQVRDRVAFDNVYEEFVSFDGLLSHILDLIEQRC